MTPEEYETRAGRAVRRVRRAADMSQAELGRLMGITRPRVSELEAGKRSVRLSTLRALADALGFEPLELLAELER